MENLTNIIDSKVADLANKVQIKTGRLAGVVDGDTSKFLGEGSSVPETIRESSNTVRYDANENEHLGFQANKSDYAMQTQKDLAGRLFGKPTNAVTQQDMYDVANMQTVQKTADMYRGAGEPRWDAPLISGSVKPDLSMVDAPIQVQMSDKVDVNGRRLESFINPSTGINITEEAANDPRLNAFKKPMLDPRALGTMMGASSGYVPVGTDDGTAANDIQPGTRLGIGAKISAAPGAFAGSVVGGVAGVADFLTGGRVIGGDNVETVQDVVGKTLGYDKADFRHEDAIKQQLMKDTFDKVKLMNPDTYGNVDWNKAGELFAEGVTDPIMLSQSLGLLVGGAGVGGAGVKAGVKLLSKGEDVINAANKSKTLIAESTALSDVEKASKIADIDNGITLADKIGNVATKGSGALGYGATMTSQDMAEYAKNNEGELPGFARTMGMFAANTLAVAVPELATTKFALGMDKVANEKLQGVVSNAIGKSLTHLAMGGIAELPQETIQAVVQSVNQKWGTDTYKDKTIAEVVNESTTDILGQGLLGAAGGLQMATPKAVGYATGLESDKLNMYMENRKADAENLRKANNMDAVSAVTADAGLHIDKASNIVAGLDPEFDLRGKTVGQTVDDYVKNTTDIFEVAGITNPEQYAYDLITRRSIQKALDSGDEGMVGRVHDTLKELHEAGKIDASELVSNDVSNIMGGLSEMITKLNVQLKDKSEMEGKKLLEESEAKAANIVYQLEKRRSMLDRINVRGSDEQLPAMMDLEEAIKIATDYQKNKDITAVSKDIMDKGFTHINPTTGEIGESKASINAYKKAAMSALTGSKLGEDALKINTNIANSLVSNIASPTNLGNLDKFAESRITKLTPTKNNPVKYSTESYLQNMLDENNAILDVANKIKATAEASKLVTDANKVAYSKNIDSVIAKTTAANTEINKRLDAIAEAKKDYVGGETLSYVQRADGTSGVYEGFSTQEDGKETGRAIGSEYKGKDVAELTANIAKWKKLVTDLVVGIGEGKPSTPQQKFLDDLTANIEKAQKSIDQIKYKNRLSDLTKDKVYTKFMEDLKVNKPEEYDVARRVQDEAYIDKNNADEIKTAVSDALKAYRAEQKTKPTEEVVEDTPAEPKTKEELKDALVAKTNEIWTKYEGKLAEYTGLVDSIEDINLVAGLKMYKKNVQKELNRSQELMNKWKAKLGDKTTSKEYVKLTSMVITKYMDPLFKELKKLIYKTINKFKLQRDTLRDEVIDVTKDIAELQALTDAYNSSVESFSVKTPVGEITKRVEGAFGPEVTVGNKRVKVEAGEVKGKPESINAAMNRIVDEQVKAAVAEVVSKGGIEGELLENIMDSNPMSADKRLFKVTEAGFLGSKSAVGIWNKSADEVISSLPADFRGFFGKNTESKAELVDNVDVMKKFVAGIKTVEMQEAMYKGKELFRVNPETGVLEATKFAKTYKVADIARLTADGKLKGQKVGDVILDANGEPEYEDGPKSGFNALSLIGKKEKVKTKINGKDVVTGIKIVMPDRFNDMIKFYSAKVVADIGSLASEIAYEDDSETAKRYGMYGESIDKIKELAKNGQVPLVSVLSEPARAIYKQLGIKGTDMMPEVTEEGIISSIEAVLAMTVLDNELVEIDNYKVVDDKLVKDEGKVDEKEFALGKKYRMASVSKSLPVDKRELTASINKLQYLSSSRDRRPPMLEKGKDRFDRTMMHTDVPISKLSNEMANKQEKIPYTLDVDGIQKYKDMSDADALVALGEQSVEGKHISRHKKIESINDKIKREWDTLKSYATILAGKTFFLPWGQTISGRDTLVTDLNFEESKMHREFTLAEGKATELDVQELVKDPLSNKALVAGINQGLDLDPDKLSNASTEKAFTDTWKITKDGVELGDSKAANKVRDMWNNMDDPKAIAKVFHETEGYHGVKAVETMKKLHKAILAGAKKVRITLGVETDAITSGMILTLIQIGTETALKFAEKGGLFTKESLAKHTAYVKYWLGEDVEFTPGALIEAGKKHATAIEDKADGKITKEQLKLLEGQPSSLTDDGVFKDLYSTIGIAMVESVKAYQIELEKDIAKAPNNAKLLRKKMLLDQIGELKLSNVRSIAKSPVMVYIYGAEINSIKQKLVYSLGVETLVKKIEELRKGILAGDNVDELKKFVYSYVDINTFESITGNKIWQYEVKDGVKVVDPETKKPKVTEEYKAIAAKSEADRLLHVSLEDAVDKLTTDIGLSFGEGIEKAFGQLSFVDDNRDRVKSVELMTFEAYKVILKQKITNKLAAKGIKDGTKSHLSKEDLADIQAEMLDEGFGHVATIDPEGGEDVEKIHQPLKNDSAKQALDEMATVHRIVDGKPKASNASIRVKKEMAGTGAAPTITIHMQDGTVMRKVLTLDGDSWRGDNVYDAIITGIDSALMENNSKVYNTQIVETVFNRSILADNIWKLEAMLSYIQADEKMYAELVANMSLEKASGNTGLTNDKQRLGLGTNRMLDVLQDAIKLSKERQVNSAKDFYVAHTFNYGYANPVTMVKGGKFRSKAIASIDGISKLLGDVNAKDMKEQGYTILVSGTKGVKNPKKVSARDVVKINFNPDKLTKEGIEKGMASLISNSGAKTLLTKAIEVGAEIVNTGLLKYTTLKDLVKSAEPKAKQDKIASIMEVYGTATSAPVKELMRRVALDVAKNAENKDKFETVFAQIIKDC